MTVEQKRCPMRADDDLKLALHRRMIGTVRGLEPLLELGSADRPAPKIAILLRAGGHDPEAPAGAGADSISAGAGSCSVPITATPIGSKL